MSHTTTRSRARWRRRSARHSFPDSLGSRNRKGQGSARSEQREPVQRSETASWPRGTSARVVAGGGVEAVFNPSPGPTRIRKPKRHMSQSMATRLATAAEGDQLTATERAALLKAARVIQRCSESVTGYRCGHALCPRCRARKAKCKTRPKLERKMRQVLPVKRLVHVTTTVAVDDVGFGIAVLTHALSRLRRRVVWRKAFAGGESHIDVKRAAAGGVRRWNVHAHSVVEANSNATVDHHALAALWHQLLKHHGCAGQLHVVEVSKPWGAP